ncbi:MULTISPECIES: HlyD family type I secretion periplasmic adaptor subunit [Ramlibacter]|uniref:Membrane fusion protein (MFP) family protein n=1 Tax=Ramlibacter pinisoli TaxID=2682844 RepID=A0A6N8ISG2_9BURK|nr:MULTISPECIES: HlyD family type I secretion periplasmic adaptor subunit [Ramlibacter]MBA2964803.1 HlyD family type I secretion periplasmic adaptor subunit [Ramlibacter sp. CGMCC 1.13660]MVQ29768.1 HlyD family type I secretion periplasmic adaptor subunit [Ramlibacter pinisoli]
MSSNQLALQTGGLMPPPDIAGASTDAEAPAEWGWWILLLAFGVFLAWAALAPLDKGVPLSGTVTVATNRKAVQHLNGGTVETILVKEGDAVKAGDPLVRMVAVLPKANADSLRVQYLAARAAEARLLAERDGARSIVFPAELEALRTDPRADANLQLQRQLFSSRQAALVSELAAFDENIAGVLQQNRGLVDSREGKKQQLQFLREQVDGMRDLAAGGYVARNRLLELERSHSQLLTAIAEDTSSIAKGERQVAELKLRRLQRLQEYQKDVRSQLADAQREADGLGNKLTALDHDLQNVVVRAPVDGTVVGMNIFTNGGVVPPGQKMMDIVPADDPLVVDGQLPVHLVDKVRPDLPVNLIFSAFNQNVTPQIPGLITHVSADRMVDDKTGQPYYNVKAKVAPEGRQMISALNIRPGMPVDLFVKTGERTLMNYMLKPLIDHFHMAMREE